MAPYPPPGSPDAPFKFQERYDQVCPVPTAPPPRPHCHPPSHPAGNLSTIHASLGCVSHNRVAGRVCELLVPQWSHNRRSTAECDPDTTAALLAHWAWAPHAGHARDKLVHPEASTSLPRVV